MEDKKTNIIDQAKELYELNGFELQAVNGHEGGRNAVYICSISGEKKYVLRISATGDRTEEDYLAETEFVHYLAAGGALVADVIPSKNGRLVERIASENASAEPEETAVFASLFEFAKGMLLYDNGYRYREGAPLTEYFYNTGKTLGAIHRLAKTFTPKHRRADYFDKFNMDCIGQLIPNEYAELKTAIADRIRQFKELPKTPDNYGLVHFDFCDGNYHVDMSNGNVTAFDFDNCCYCWYMFDLAHLWTHGIGWFMQERDVAKRREGMDWYFSHILSGYRSETDVSEEELSRLPLYIDMTIIEYVVDEFECAAREGEDVDPEDIEDEAECLINGIPYGGYFAE
ncbi:MAG: phosphotransferase [Lachnospiraceae bacterium]|nr:phosphotransferase [Lachnospiraceae bacterium]